ncbi:MAG TPA: transposase [Thermoanaerobaculia bacterium]|nr:transposase [Thermoanaerobaculia bacterium]
MVDWPHAPLHRFTGGGIYFVTASTYLKQPHFTDPASKDALQDLLFAKAREHDCWLQAWAILANHYHLVVSTEDGEKLHRMLARLHAMSAIEQNKRDGARGRKVWFQFRETKLTYEASWLGRLKYTHENAVHHRIVDVSTRYRWCSASWFERTAQRAFAETVRRQKIDRVNVYDEY